MKAVKKPTLNKIIKISAGTFHFLALKKVYRPPFREWSTEMLCEWIETVGFEEYTNVIVNSKMTA